MPRITSCLLACLCVGFVSCNPILVSVQSKSQQEMDELTAAIDEAAETGTGPGRTTLGVIEATMSRVVDVDDPYVTTQTASVPTWGMLQDISYDVNTNIWTFEYQTMRVDSSTTLNQFHRVLYFTKASTTYASGDTGNVCLNNVDLDTCLQTLHSNYLMSQAPSDTQADYIDWYDRVNGEDQVSEPIIVTRTPVPYSLLETITIQIPHKRIRDQLGQKSTFNHPTEGAQVQWTFGIGMLFHGVGNNVVIFDNFNLIENSFDQVAISRRNAYALAKYVTFWTSQVASNTDIRVAHVEYLLEPGFQVQSINASVNGETISDSDCSSMQSLVSGLENNGQCITRRDVCVPDLYEGVADCEGCVAYVIPLPSRFQSPFKINTLLTLKETATNAEILTTLNFETSNMQDVCKAAVYDTFNAIDHVQAELYRGYALQSQVVQGSFTVQNDTAQGLPETLLTLVLTPKDQSAIDYFNEFPQQHINLDELYISHSLFENIIEQSQPIENQVSGTGDGRTTLILDPELKAACHVEGDDAVQFNYDETLQCATTKDWDLTGAKTRPQSSPAMYFVQEINLVSPSSDTQNWLSSNIFAGSTSSANTFLQNTVALVPEAKRDKSKAYYVFPIYQWPDQSPIGLKDTSVVSFAWSVSEYTASSRRRLLSVPVSKIFSKSVDANKVHGSANVKKIDLKRKHKQVDFASFTTLKSYKSK